MMTKVVIGRFGSPREAEEVAEQLRDDDITVDLSETGDSGGDLVGGVELRVDEGEVDRAREVLGVDAEASDEGDDPFAEIEASEEEEWDDMTRGLHCPECQSQEIGAGSPYLWGYLSLTVVLLAGIFALPTAASYLGAGLVVWIVVGIWAAAARKFPLHCKECGHAGERGEFDPTAALED